MSNKNQELIYLIKSFFLLFKFDFFYFQPDVFTTLNSFQQNTSQDNNNNKASTSGAPSSIKLQNQNKTTPVEGKKCC